MRKAFMLALAAGLLVLPFTTAFAATGWRVCNVEDCTETGLHYHDGSRYLAHYADDGHDYHPLCEVQDCYQTCPHYHDGNIYCGNQQHCGRGVSGYQSGARNNAQSATQANTRPNTGSHHRGGRH